MSRSAWRVVVFGLAGSGCLEEPSLDRAGEVAAAAGGAEARAVAPAAGRERHSVIVCEDLTGVQCFGLADPETCCPSGSSLVGYTFNCALCLEDVPSNRNVLTIQSDLTQTFCEDLADPATCCPPGYDAAGFNESLSVNCIGR